MIRAYGSVGCPAIKKLNMKKVLACLLLMSIVVSTTTLAQGPKKPTPPKQTYPNGSTGPISTWPPK